MPLSELTELTEGGPTHSYASANYVTVFVGQKRYQYYVPKDALVLACPFFEKCLSVGMVEERTNTIDLPDDNCLAFDPFLLWVQDRTTPLIVEYDNAEEYAFALMNGWVLADKFCMPVWQNKLMDNLSDYYYGGDCAHIKPLHVLWMLDKAGEHSCLFKFGRDRLLWDLMLRNHIWKEEWDADLTQLLKRWNTQSVFREWLDRAGDIFVEHSSVSPLQPRNLFRYYVECSTNGDWRWDEEDSDR